MTGLFDVATGERPPSLDLGLVAAVARRWWWALLAGALAGVVLISVVASGPRRYEASAKALVGPTVGTFNQLKPTAEQAQTYTQLSTSVPVLAQTARQVHWPSGLDALRRAITTGSDSRTRILTITVAAPHPALAAATANVLWRTLEASLVRTDPTAPAPMRMIEPAVPPTAPAPRWSPALALIAALAGMLAALSLALVAQVRAPRAVREADLRGLGTPFLGRLPRRRRASASRSAPAVSRAYELVATTLALIDGERPPRALIVCGPRPGERGGEVAAGVMKGLAAGGWSVMAAPEDLDPARLDELEEQVDVVVVDAAGADAALAWAPRPEAAVLLVARRWRTRRASIAPALNALRHAGLHIAGIVLADRAPRSWPRPATGHLAPISSNRVAVGELRG